MKARRWHRQLAWLAAITVLLWAGSGLTHPLMSLLGPRAVQFQAPAPAQDALPVDLAAQLSAAAVGPISGARRLLWAGESWTQVWRAAEQPALYVRDGRAVEARDGDYAEWLARHFSGSNADVAEREWITQFSAQYPDNNRVLPVWRIRFDGGLEVVVETAEDRLITLSDGRRRLLTLIFRQAHTLAFLDAYPRLRLGMISMLIGSLMAMTLLGIRMALTRGGRSPLRRAHRWAGAALALPLLAWTGTGLFHLWTYGLKPEEAPPHREAALWEGGSVPPEGLRRLIRVEGDFWGLDSDGQYVQGDRRLAPAEMARRVAGIETAVDVELLPRFSAEYGFINRRLPVWRVPDDQGVVHFVDLSRAQRVTSVSALDRAELWSFNQIHKWQMADGLGRQARDAVMSAVALMLLLLAGAGIVLRRR